jgi:hypothetical protein
MGTPMWGGTTPREGSQAILCQKPEDESYQLSAGYATAPEPPRSADRRPRVAPRSLDPGAARPVDWDYRFAFAIIVLIHIS